MPYAVRAMPYWGSLKNLRNKYMTSINKVNTRKANETSNEIDNKIFKREKSGIIKKTEKTLKGRVTTLRLWRKTNHVLDA